MTFDPNDPQITAYVFGELVGEELADFEARLQEEPELQEAVEQIHIVSKELAADMESGEAPRLSESRRDAIAQAQGRSRSAPVASSPVSGSDSPADKGGSTPIVVAQPAWGSSATLAIGAGLALVALLAIGLRTGVFRANTDRIASSDLDDAEGDDDRSDANSEDADREPNRTVKDQGKQVSTTGGKTTPATTGPATATGGVKQGPSWKEAGPVGDSKGPSQQNGQPGRARSDITKFRTPVKPTSDVVAGSTTSPSSPTPPSGLGGGMFGNEIAVFGGGGGVQPGSRGGDQGQGAGNAGDRFDMISENIFHRPLTTPKSTFSIDVDTASYSKVRMYLTQTNSLPRPDAVRIEEMINYFSYGYDAPQDETPFSSRLSLSECPWQPTHRLVRVGLQGRRVDEERPPANLVFLIDVSGSMSQPNKLPLLKRSMKMLAEQLGENDKVSMVVYANATGLVLPPTNGTQTPEILGALDRLSAGGSTNGGQGINLAYDIALENFIPGGSNRVILCTDGDFNVGTTGTDALVRLAADKAEHGVQLSVLGFGMGNHNDSMLEQVSNRANGNYAFIDSFSEARKVLVDQMQGTLVTIAKDVKIQVEFNPATVAAYRLIGYENRMLKTEDFDDDKKDAGEIGAGHCVTALYEVIPAGVESPLLPEIATEDKLKYQKRKVSKESGDDLLTLYVRYKDPEADKSKKLTFVLNNQSVRFGKMDEDFRFATAVASFGMLLRRSKFAGDSSFAAVEEIASSSLGDDRHGYRAEFVELVKIAAAIRGE